MNAKLVDPKTLKNLKNITESERRKILVAYLQEQIAKLVGIETSDIEEQQPLQYLGIDSLIAVKLRNRLRADLSVDISAVKFMADASLTDLVVAVSQLLNESGAEISASNAGQKDNYSVPQSYPLTYGQQGLWFLFKLAPLNAAYNISFTARICSSLNIPALQRAVQKLVDRHPTLRTIFKQQDSEPFQEVCEHQEVCIKQIDASTWNWDELREKAMQRGHGGNPHERYAERYPLGLYQEAIAAHRYPFDLEQGPLLRVDLFTRSEQDHFLLLSIHHIAIDGFSFGILLDELRLLYQSESTGQTVSLPPIERQYWDFVQWQREMLKSPVGEAHWNYWHQQLGGELPILKLPVDRPRSVVKNQRGASYTFELDRSLTARLRATAKEQGATLYMTLLAAFQVLLYRYTGQEDIIVGSPTEGRSQSEFAKTVGFFINMLALRVKITGELTFSALLSQVRQTVLDGLAHQDYPSPLLIERLQVNHDATLPGLFQVAFNLLKLQDMGADYELSVSESAKTRSDWGGLSLEPFVIPQQEGQYDLNLDMMETTESIFGIFRYDTDLFEAATIRRTAGHFQNLLSAIVENPQQAVGELPLLSEAERHQLLREWNDTATEYPRDKCIHQLFEEQVEKTPDAVAVMFENQQLTYLQLNQRANQLAYHLKSLGVEPEVLVGICVERSVEMVVGLLGILKAGGAYVPLDPTYPPERLQFMLANARVSVLVTQAHLLEILPDHEAQLVYLDKDWSTIAHLSAENLHSGATSENLAYVIYTSGSTGKPKGVQGLQRGTINRLHWMWKTYPFQQDEICCQKTSLSFIDSVWEIFGGLLKGIPTVMIPDEVVKDPYSLIQTLSHNRVSRIVLVPSLLSAILDTGIDLRQKLAHLKYWVTSGEILEANLYRQFYCTLPESLLINLYGSSEVSADATCYEIHSSFESYFLGNLSRLQNLVGCLPEESHIAPQKPEEEVLVEIWKKVLCLEKVGVKDNFFKLGGDKALAAKMIAYIRYVLDVSLPANILQAASDIQSLADSLRHYENEPGKAATIARLLKQIQMSSPEAIQTALTASTNNSTLNCSTDHGRR